MAYTYKSEGIILKRWSYKDADRLLRILTRDYGKLTARAISARKANSKLAGHIEPLIRADLFFAASKSIDILAGSVILDAHKRIRQSVEALSIVSVFSEVLDVHTQERFVDHALYDFARDFFAWLNTHPANLLVLYAAVIQLFSVLGYHIELYHCHQCKRAVPYEPAQFHLQLWTIECSACRVSDGDVLPLRGEMIKVLRFFHEQPFDQVAKLRLTPQEWKEADTVVRSIVRYHSDRPLKSESMLLSMFATSNNR